MNWLLRLLLFLLGQQFKRRFFRDMKKQGLVAYLRFLRALRLMFIVTVGAFLTLQLMVLAGVGMVITGVMNTAHPTEYKMEILFWIFSGAFAVPALLLLILMSERLWFNLSGAARLMDDLD